MTFDGWFQIIVFSLAILAIAKPLGLYLVHVYDGSVRWLRPIERVIYRVAGVNADDDQHWTRYAGAMLLFSAASMLLTYVALRVQHLLPMNPQDLGALPDRQAFETAASFTTNTNWQSYGGESTMSYFSQMSQLTFHNFVSAAVGMAVAVALVRGIARRSGDGRGRIGNFWVDLTRGTLYVLIPLSLIWALAMVQQGVIQNFHPYLQVTTLEGATQTIAMGPVGSQEAIKQIGTNGGGFFNANSAHPFENPTPWSNFLSVFAIFAIPSALVYLLGRMVGNTRHGWSVWSAMFLLFLAGTGVTYSAEARGNPTHAARGLDVATTAVNPGGNMEGKETRFGIANSALYSVVTTDASCGAVNAMHDSFTPLAGMVTMVNMQLGEVIFGGVGAGLYGMIIFIVLTVFIAGLMVGRTPEYLGKKLQAREVQMAMLYVLASAASILVFTAISAVSPSGLQGLNNSGPHGLSELLYAFTSTTANNGSAFAGLTGSTYWYNTQFGVAMLVGRFALIVPLLALAGFLAEKKSAPASAGTFPVEGPVFSALLIGVVIVVGALTFFPALALGPIVEHFSMGSGGLF
ncbi:potassium-transporting ATPase subunit KdpA [Gemmatimonas groenlandica]|uniref:Potassium-transporting ATPase potassium-binding subunit n=1 Tax=Gemmatimonas groenlandica TaxID=2732249 RepID=A0A6M4IRA9_9BACT|nr:potassium-transporting ATPase subunit KdpA [Gemmatimonas groenlandica]QJR36309.1 potassium-transporting ATPase subunit KdpA [Gemmatimonas groenlandica]